MKLDDLDGFHLNDMRDTVGAFNETQGWRKKSDEIEKVLKEHAPDLVPIFKNYVIGTMVALLHSELSEALEGVRKDTMDDHLPNRKTVEVEIADAQIRILDFADYLNLDLGGAVVAKDDYNHHREDHKMENRMKIGGKKF